MPTAKPRVHVVLEPELFAVIRRIGDVQGKSASKVLRELITPTEPVLRQLADTLERAASLDKQDRRTAVLNSSRAMLDEASSAISDLQNQMSIFDVEGVSGGDEEAPTGAPADASAEAGPTPGSNTGVTLAGRSPKKRVKS